jgi:exodeoxyribonuclease VII small subunit
MSDEPSLASFESALDDLKRIVEEMEGGSLSLEASLAAFERGIQLTRQCQTALGQAQLRVQMLTSDGLVDVPGAAGARGAAGASLDDDDDMAGDEDSP